MKKTWLLLTLPLLVVAGMAPRIYTYVQKHLIIPDVTVAGFIQMADGLGRQSVELIDTLKDQFDVHFIKTRCTYDLKEVPKAIHPILINRKRPLGRVVIFEDSLAHPLERFEKIFHQVRKKQIRLAYSMFEASKIPSSVVDKLHHYFDAVIVADPYNSESYHNSGVTLPIFTLPLGLDLDLFMKAPLKSKPHTPFVFGSFAACEPRKNYLTMIQAFALAFGNRDDVLLKINARRGFTPEIEAVQEKIKELGLNNVSFVVESVDRAQYLKNFQSIDCYVSFSKGEGFSIQPREALALGIPVILSDNTAQSTICHSGFAKSVPAFIEEPAFYEALPEDDYGSHFNVSLDDAAAAFHHVLNHYNDYLSHAEAARAWVSQYEYKHLKSLYHTLVKPGKILFGENNFLTHDVLITNNKELYDKYLQLYPHLRP